MIEGIREERSGREPAARAAPPRARFGPAARLAVLGVALIAPGAAFAYVGPGAGLGLLGIVAAVLAALVMGFYGLVMWPIRKLAQQRKAQAQKRVREHETRPWAQRDAAARGTEDR